MSRNQIEIVVKTTGAKKAQTELSGLSEATGGLASVAGKLAGGLTLGVLAAQIAKYGIEAANTAAQAERLRNATEGLARSVGTDAAAMIAAISDASGGAIDQITALTAANKALIFGLVDNADQMAQMTEIAVTLGRAMGQDAAKSIDDMTTALGRQSPLILDNLGILTDVEGWQKKYAESIGKTVQQLTDAEKKQAFVNGALEAGSDAVARMGGLQDDSAAAGERLNAVLSDLSVTIGNKLTPAMSGAKSETADFLDRVDKWLGKNENAASQLEYLRGVLKEYEDIGADNLTDRAKQDAAHIKAMIHELEIQQEAAVWVDHQNRATRDATAAIERNAAIEKKQVEWQQLLASIARDRAITEMQIARAMEDEDDSAYSISQSFLNNISQVREQQQTLTEEMSQSFDELASQLESVVSGVMQPTLQEVWQPPESARIDEWARRAATLATEGLNSEWIPQLQEQFGGTTFWQPVADAISSGDDSAVRQAMTNLLSGTRGVPMWDKDEIKRRVREQLQQDRLRDALLQEVVAELNAEGTQVGIGDVQGVMGSGLSLMSGITAGMPNAVKNAGTAPAIIKALETQFKENEKEMAAMAEAFARGFDTYLPDALGMTAGVFIDTLTDHVADRLGVVGWRQ